MLALTRFLVLCAAMLALPANASAQPGPAFISPYDGASINDNDALVFNVVPVPNAGGFGGGYLWAIVQGGRGIIWENWRDTHTLNGPTLVIAKGSTAYNVIPKDTWVI